MSDNTEKITVEVDGTNASEGFGKIKTGAREADDAIDRLGQTTDRAQGSLNQVGSAGQRAAAGLNQAGSAGNQAASGINQAGTAAQQATSHFTALQNSLFGQGRGTAVWLWDLAADGFRSALGFANAFIDRIAGVQRTISMLNNIPGANAGAEFEYLIGVANKYGLSLQSIQNDYAKYTMSAQNSSLTNDQVRRSFEQVSMAVRTLHMNQQQAQFTFLALEQMLSKGQVSLQELRRQFAERIPGAMQALAREMGVTMPQLLNFITKVGAASDKLMPVLGDALQRMTQGGISNAVQALDAQRNRLETSITVFFEKVLTGGGAQGMTELLKTVQGLLQTDTIAEVFSNAMNSITTSIAGFLRGLKTEDIDKFATSALSFLENLAKLAVAAAQAVIFLGQHIPEVGAAIGAFAGASAGAPFGPWGAGIGLVVGGAAGYMFGKKVNSDGFGPGSNAQSLMAQQAENDAKIAKLTQQIENPTMFDKFGQTMDPTGNISPAALKQSLASLKAENIDIMMRLNKLNNDQYEPLDTPILGSLRDMITGSDKTVEEYLRKTYGIGGKNKKEEQLQTRQNNFMQSLLAKAQGVMDPEEDKFENLAAQARRIGLGENATTTDSKTGKTYALQELIDILQNDFNRRAQEKSDKKTGAIDTQFNDMMTMITADKDKFREKYSPENLLQVNDQPWEQQARKMTTALDKEMIQLKSEWDRRAEKNPLAILGVDRDTELKNLREFGEAYINEFKRIEAEKKTVMGGTTSFLKDWNESANNFGQITKDFLKGVTDNIVDMLTNMVMTGHLSFAKLTEFVLAYIAKMMIVQAITPFVNMFAGALSSGLSSLLSIGSDVGSSMYSFGSSGSGLGLKARASGGPVMPGEPYLVGERGPEVVSFDRPGYVHPTESLRGGGGSTYVSVNVDASGQTSTSGSNSSAELGRRVANAVRAVIVDEKRPGGLLA